MLLQLTCKAVFLSVLLYWKRLLKLFAVPARLVGWGGGHGSIPGADTTRDKDCGTWCLQGKPAPAPAQPLWGHILPALPMASICECLTWSASVAVWYSLYSWSNSPNVYLHAHRHGQWHPPSDCHSGDRAALQAAETHLNSSKKGEKCCIWYLFVPCLREGKKDFSHVNEGRVAVFWVMRLRASNPHTKWEKEICHLWQSEQPCCLLCLR